MKSEGLIEVVFEMVVSMIIDFQPVHGEMMIQFDQQIFNRVAQQPAS